MKAKILKDIVNSIDDDTEIFIRNSMNSCGNVSELIQIELATYGFFGQSLPCLILNSNNVTGDYCYAKNKDNVLDFVERGPSCSLKK